MNDATALAADIAAGRQTAVSAMETALERAAAHSGYGAIVRMEPELGLARAKAADSADSTARGPFHGVPFLAKDLGGYGEGLAPGAGNKALRARSEGCSRSVAP